MNEEETQIIESLKSQIKGNQDQIRAMIERLNYIQDHAADVEDGSLQYRQALYSIRVLLRTMMFALADALQKSE